MTFFGGFQFPLKVDTVSRKAKNKICRYNVSGSGTISLQELKIMMEKLGAPQTHLGLKAMIKEVSKMRRMRTRMSNAKPPIAYHCRRSLESLIRLGVKNQSLKFSQIAQWDR